MRYLSLLAVIVVVGCNVDETGKGNPGIGGSGSPGPAAAPAPAAAATPAVAAVAAIPAAGSLARRAARCSRPTTSGTRTCPGGPSTPPTRRRMTTLVGAVNIHPDFGPGFGIPINVVPASQAKVPIDVRPVRRRERSGTVPVSRSRPAIRVEGTDESRRAATATATSRRPAGDLSALRRVRVPLRHHRLDLRQRRPLGSHQEEHGQRPDGWTSVDAAGLSIYAGLARYEEVMAGEITHAIRFTLPCTSDARVPPATHQAVPGSCASRPTAPPMGLRVRLKASYDISGFTTDGADVPARVQEARPHPRRQRRQLEHVLLPERGQRELAGRDQRPQGRPRVGLRGRRSCPSCPGDARAG